MGILSYLLNLLGRLYAVLHLTESFQILCLLLGNLQFHRGNLFVLCLGHCLGGVLQSLARHLKLRAYPTA